MIATHERDWDQDFDLAAWQALDPHWRKQWIEDAWAHESDATSLEDLYTARRQRYERGQTAWDIGLEPLAFDLTLAEAVGEAKPEHGDGILFGDPDLRLRVLSALLANAGLRRAVHLAPPRVWEQALARRAAHVAWEHALKADRRGARYAPPPPVDPVTRPEFVLADGVGGWANWVRHELAQPFYHWNSSIARDQAADLRVLELGYLAIGAHTLARSDLLVLHEPWRPGGWPQPSDAALLVEVAPDEGALQFTWEVRRQAYLEAGATEVWLVDLPAHRLLRQSQGSPVEIVPYGGPGQTIAWRSRAGDAVEVHLSERAIAQAGIQLPQPARPHESADFGTFSAAATGRLEGFETPWSIGHTPQPFESSIVDILGWYKDELWQGTLFGPDYQRDTLLSMLLANVGLRQALRLAPLELWQQALARA